MALLGVVASISVLGKQREEDCHRFEARQAPYSQRGGDTVLCESTHEVLVLSAELVHLHGFLNIRVMSGPMLMPDTEVGAGNPDSGLVLAWQALDSVTQFPTPREIFPWRRSKHVKAFIYLPTGLSVSKAYFSLYSLSERATKYHLCKGNAYPILFGFLDI